MSQAGGATGDNERGAWVTNKRLSCLTQFLPALTSPLAEMGVFCLLPFPSMVSPQILDCLLPAFDAIRLEMMLQQTRSSKLSTGHAPLTFLKAECLGTQKVGQVLETFAK